MAKVESIEEHLQAVEKGLHAIEALSWVLDPIDATGSEDSARAGYLLRHLVEEPMRRLELARGRVAQVLP